MICYHDSGGSQPERMVRLLLKCKTSRIRAEKIRSFINTIFRARLTGEPGKYEIRFNVPENDTKHIWLMLVVKDAKDMKTSYACRTTLRGRTIPKGTKHVAPAMPEKMYECPSCKCWHGGEPGLCFKCGP